MTFVTAVLLVAGVLWFAINRPDPALKVRGDLIAVRRELHFLPRGDHTPARDCRCRPRLRPVHTYRGELTIVEHRGDNR